MATVTVIIVNWNAGGYLRRCLATLARQTCRDFNTVVVDNASPEGHPQWIVDEFPEVELICLDENIGFAAANNLAVQKYVQTEYIALLNPDAFPEPEWLEELLAAAGQYPESASFGSRQLCADNPEILDGTGDCYHISGLAWRRDNGLSVTKGCDRSDDIFAACAAAALYRTEVFLAVGGFDEGFFCYFEDVDLGFRLRLAGYGCRYVSGAVVHHVGSATTGRRSDFSVYYGHRNMTWCFIRNMPGLFFWLYLPLHLSAVLWLLVRFAFLGQGGVFLRAKIDALKQLPVFWEKRKTTQKTTSVDPRELRKVMTRGWGRDWLNRNA